MTRQGLTAAVAAIAPAALVAAGCGEDSSGDDFAAEVGEICEDAQQLNADAVEAGEEVGLPAVCTTGSAEPAPAE